MASIQEIATAAHRIGQSAKEAQQRTMTCAETLRSSAGRLAATVRGSKSGENAVLEVQAAERTVRESAARLLTLQSTIERFVQDLTK